MDRPEFSRGVAVLDRLLELDSFCRQQVRLAIRALGDIDPPAASEIPALEVLLREDPDLYGTETARAIARIRSE